MKEKLRSGKQQNCNTPSMVDMLNILCMLIDWPIAELVFNVHVRIFLFLSKSSLILIKNFNLSGGGTDLVVVYTWRCLLLLLSRGTSSGKILWYHVLIMVRHCGCPDSGKNSWYPVLIIIRHCRCPNAGKTLWYPVIILASQNGTLYWFW